MAKKKDATDAVVSPNEVPNTGLLNPNPPLQQTKTQSTTVDAADTIIDEVDFNELLDLEKAIRQTEEQFNKIAGNIKRLEKDLDIYHTHEKNLNGQIDTKRKELIRRYKLDEQRQWRIDINTRKIVYQN